MPVAASSLTTSPSLPSTLPNAITITGIITDNHVKEQANPRAERLPHLSPQTIMALRHRISPPLEAGPSLLDAHRLPPQLVSALEHIAARVDGRCLHLMLVAVRRDYQLPGAADVPAARPSSSSSSSSSSSPSMRCSGSSGRFSWTGLRRFVSVSRADQVASVVPSWMPCSPPLTPSAFPGAPTTTTTDGRVSSELNPQQHQQQGWAAGWKFLHAPDLSARGRATQHAAFTKAAQRFGMGSRMLSPAVSPSTCQLPDQLYYASLAQNEVLFEADGLTVVSLDRLYSLKSALASYEASGGGSNSKCPLRLEDAVDELRRCVLANNGAEVRKTDLLRSYGWLRVSEEGVAELDQMYRWAYGGEDQVGGIAADHGAEEEEEEEEEESLKTNWWEGDGDVDVDDEEVDVQRRQQRRQQQQQQQQDEVMVHEEQWRDQEEARGYREEQHVQAYGGREATVFVDPEQIGLALTTMSPAPPPPPPSVVVVVLPRLNTNLPREPHVSHWDYDTATTATTSSSISSGGGIPSTGGQQQQRYSAWPLDTPSMEVLRWTGCSMDPGIFGPAAAAGGVMTGMMSRGSSSSSRWQQGAYHVPPPLTPNAYEDISPVTRGEWGHLVMEGVFRGARRAVVETC
ncbi:hypothetical protein AAL_04527 [Moelleriella libera RCEF 2490]|uniref:DUF7582 domain-containing protein n=1 Tax=Moelleriella libera RCEF 2490 TaxID=1081109 RepID=A0A168BH20_9HYPO|nr:hypothetical protein AAL_04527 [Moelleriella libera RCEF 2490]